VLKDLVRRAGRTGLGKNLIHAAVRATWRPPGLRTAWTYARTLR